MATENSENCPPATEAAIGASASNKRSLEEAMGVGKRGLDAESTQPKKKQRTDAGEKQPPTANGERRSIRIGILLTKPSQEQKKEELVPISDKNRPWNKFVQDSRFIKRRIFRKGEKIKKPERRLESVPADVSIGAYVNWAYGQYGVEVDFILPSELSVERCRQNDLNFLLIYDLLEAYHTDKKADKPVYNELIRILDTCDNIYPNLEYQQFINSKIKYYNYLKEHKIPTAPTETLTKEEFLDPNGKWKGDEKAVATHLMDIAKAENWRKMIAKPVYGQEAIGCQTFVTWCKYSKNRNALARYIKKNLQLYPGLVFQKFIEGFGVTRKCPELRLYHIGDEYHYSMCATNGSYARPREEGGNFDFPLDRLRPDCMEIFKKLPPIVVQGKTLPRLLTRFDIGYKDAKGNDVPTFVNEIEFVPSLYIEDHPFVVENHMGDQMVKITLELLGMSLEQLKAAE